MNFLRRLLSRLLFMVQSMKIYRRLMRVLFANYSICEATQKDMMNVKIWLELNEEEARARERPGMTCLVAKKGNIILGYVELSRNPPTDPLYPGYWLRSLLIKPVFRGMAVGEALTQEVLRRASDESVESIYLVVREDNFRAGALYEKMGFELIDLPYLRAELDQQKWVDSHPRIAMVKHFSQPAEINRIGK